MGPSGAIIMSFFAFIFCALALDQRTTWLDPRLAGPLLVSAAIIALSVRALRARGGTGKSDPRVDRVILWSSAAEGIAIFVMFNVFANVGLADRATPGMAAIVALHFVPMAYAIPFPPFYWIGAAIMVAAVAGFVVAPPLCWLVSGIGAAAALWVAAIMALRRPASIRTA